MHPPLDNFPDPALRFPHFYNSAVPDLLGGTRRWSISTKDKMPIDVQALVTTGHIHGAKVAHADTELFTLNELRTHIPGAANCAYYLNAQVDNVIIIDIEPECPPQVTAQLLTLLRNGTYYAETSMSGKGYHIVAPLPENFHQYPDATAKPALKHPQGWFEILLNHWVTFTRNPISDEVMATMPAPGTYELTPEKLWDNCAPHAVAPTTTHTEIDLEELYEDISDEDKYWEKDVATDVLYQFKRYRNSDNAKTLEDFSNDHSRYEFSQISIIANMVIENYLDRIYYGLGKDLDATLDTEIHSDIIVRITYIVVQQSLEHRPKHDEQRGGMDYLLYRVMSNVETIDFNARKEKFKNYIQQREKTALN